MESKTLIKLFNIYKGDVVSIVGSGGKTTMMFSLAKELKNKFNVLVTTSTKILEPSREDYDYLYTDIDSFIENKINFKKGTTVISKGINVLDNKLIGIDNNDLDKILNYFDIVIIEADGSRCLPAKGWKKNEPPILLKTNKTIGIIPISIMDKLIDESFICGYEEFKNIVGSSKYIDYEAIRKICYHKEGLFKNSKGEKFLFINQADDQEKINKSLMLGKYINENKDEKLNFKICFGSLKKEIYFENNL